MPAGIPIRRSLKSPTATATAKTGSSVLQLIGQATCFLNATAGEAEVDPWFRNHRRCANVAELEAAAVMSKKKRSNMAEIRSSFARLMAAASGSADPRLPQAFASVPREAFVGP